MGKSKKKTEVSMNVYVEAKKRYLEQLQQILTPRLYEGFESLYDDALELLENEFEERREQTKSILKTFQDALREIPIWNQDIIEHESERIIQVSNCDYLDNLIDALFRAESKILTSVQTLRNSKPLKVKVPIASHFIHRCYTCAAREIFKNPFVFNHFKDLTPRDKQNNQREAIFMINEGITNAIRELLPIRDILKNSRRTGEYSDNDSGTDNSSLTGLDSDSDSSDSGVSDERRQRQKKRDKKKRDESESDSESDTEEEEESEKIELKGDEIREIMALEEEASSSDEEDNDDESSSSEDDDDNDNDNETSSEDKAETEDTSTITLNTITLNTSDRKESIKLDDIGQVTNAAESYNNIGQVTNAPESYGDIGQATKALESYDDIGQVSTDNNLIEYVDVEEETTNEFKKIVLEGNKIPKEYRLNDQQNITVENITLEDTSPEQSIKIEYEEEPQQKSNIITLDELKRREKRTREIERKRKDYERESLMKFKKPFPPSLTHTKNRDENMLSLIQRKRELYYKQISPEDQQSVISSGKMSISSSNGLTANNRVKMIDNFLNLNKEINQPREENKKKIISYSVPNMSKSVEEEESGEEYQSDPELNA